MGVCIFLGRGAIGFIILKSGMTPEGQTTMERVLQKPLPSHLLYLDPWGFSFRGNSGLLMCRSTPTQFFVFSFLWQDL